jgi:hypothetical protein
MRLVTPDGRVFPLPAGRTTIGRARDNSLVVNQPLVSRHHAAVQLEGQRCSVMDLGSSHGTTLNGQRLLPHRPYALRAGDVLALAGQASFITEPRPRTSVSGRVRRGASPLILALAVAALALLATLVVLAVLYFRPAQAPPIRLPLPAAASVTVSPAPPSPTHTLTAVPSWTPTPTPTALPPTSTPIPLPGAIVVIGQLNVRTGPGTAYPVASRVAQGSILEVKGQAYDCRWLEVVTPQEKEGWVSGLETYVTRNLPCDQIPAAPIPPRPTSAASPTPRPTPTRDTRATVRVPIQNNTGSTLRLTLDGPAHYDFTVSPGLHPRDLVPGTYRYTARGCGSATKSGTITFSPAASQWRWWCESF